MARTSEYESKHSWLHPLTALITDIGDHGSEDTHSTAKVAEIKRKFRLDDYSYFGEMLARALPRQFRMIIKPKFLSLACYYRAYNTIDLFCSFIKNSYEYEAANYPFIINHLEETPLTILANNELLRTHERFASLDELATSNPIKALSLLTDLAQNYRRYPLQSAICIIDCGGDPKYVSPSSKKSPLMIHHEIVEGFKHRARNYNLERKKYNKHC